MTAKINEGCRLPVETGLTERQREALDLLKEECAELIQAASKVTRCGPGFVPYAGTPQERPSAGAELAIEAGDVYWLLAECVEAGLLTWGEIHAAASKKREKLKVWSRHLGN